MALLSVDSRPVLAAVVRFPARGVWTATLDVDTDTRPEGRVTIACDGAAPLVGTVVRGAADGAVSRILVVGGAGGLRADVPALSLRAGTLGDVLAATLAEAGETLDATSATLSDFAAARWHRAAGPAAHAVATLAASAGLTWRVLRAGTVWLGGEGVDAVDAVRVRIDRDPALGAWTWSCDAIDAVPGELVALSDDTGDALVRLGEVVYTLDGSTLTARGIEAP